MHNWPKTETVASTLLTLWGIPLSFQMLFLRMKIVVSGSCLIEKGRIVNSSLLHGGCKRNSFFLEQTSISTHPFERSISISLYSFSMVSHCKCIFVFVRIFTFLSYICHLPPFWCCSDCSLTSFCLQFDDLWLFLSSELILWLKFGVRRDNFILTFWSKIPCSVELLPLKKHSPLLCTTVVW